jgi:TetR/AcrR family transcriptional repressor of bet genes
MPRTGAEPARRRELIIAALNAIGETGSLDVSVKEIANKAGMSSALAFHYFGGKNEIVSETMRFLLRELTAVMRTSLRGKSLPGERLEAIVEASFSASQFKRKTIAAWLVFYVHAYSSKSAARLLNIYTRRLESNLVHAYRGLLPELCQAQKAAEATAAMIDGVFIRHALRKSGPDRLEAIDICKTQIATQLAGKTK